MLLVALDGVLRLVNGLAINPLRTNKIAVRSVNAWSIRLLCARTSYPPGLTISIKLRHGCSCSIGYPSARADSFEPGNIGGTLRDPTGHWGSLQSGRMLAVGGCARVQIGDTRRLLVHLSQWFAGSHPSTLPWARYDLSLNSNSVTGDAVLTGEPMLVPEVSKESRVDKNGRFYQELRPHTMCSIPVTFTDGAKGR